MGIESLRGGIPQQKQNILVNPEAVKPENKAESTETEESKAIPPVEAIKSASQHAEDTIAEQEARRMERSNRYKFIKFN